MFVSWGPLGTRTDQPDINTPGDTLLPSPPSHHHNLTSLSDKVTELQQACGEIIVRCGGWFVFVRIKTVKIYFSQVIISNIFITIIYLEDSDLLIVDLAMRGEILCQ